ncbi:MAG: response regulator [Bacteroidales bacterium]|nr:response regulator [Bacteroidales bacterium]
MQETQKNKRIFLWQKFNVTDYEGFVLKKYLASLKISIFIILSLIIIVGISLDIHLFFVGIFDAIFFSAFLLLYKKQKIKLNLLKLISLTAILIIVLFLILSKQIPFSGLVFILFIPIFSLIIYEGLKVFLISLISISFFDLFYIFTDIFNKYDSKEVASISVVLVVFALFLYLFSQKIKEEKAIVSGAAKRQTIWMKQRQNLIGFALQQIRSTVNNLTVYDDLSKDTNLKAGNEIDLYKRLSLSSFSASLAVIEASSMGDNMNLKEKCNFFEIVKKITLYYSLNNPNLTFSNTLDNKAFNTNINKQITLIKIIFCVIDVINFVFSNQKTHIRIENFEKEDCCSLKINFNKFFNFNFALNENLIIYFEYINSLVLQIDSEIDFGNTDNSNSFFIFTFKKTIEEKTEIDEKPNDKEKKSEKKLRVLLAEDDEINQKIYTLGFESFFDKIDIAVDGEEVISMLELKKYEAIIMDLQMPKINGIEAVQKIRELEKSIGIHTPIVAITANTLIYNKTDILKFGFDDYFIKPFKIKDIYHKIIEITETQKLN